MPDVLVIGSGGAGLAAALAANDQHIAKIDNIRHRQSMHVHRITIDIAIRALERRIQFQDSKMLLDNRAPGFAIIIKRARRGRQACLS